MKKSLILSVFVGLVIPCIFATKTFAQDLFEPNDSFNQATKIELGQVITGNNIAPKQDIDYYRINIPKRGLFKVTVSDVAKEIDSFLALYNPKRERIRYAWPPDK
ncbi:MAG: hypothetical protein AB1422_16095, partial [bacterium]